MALTAKDAANNNTRHTKNAQEGVITATTEIMKQTAINALHTNK
jgi:hypothetical protein